MGGRAGRGEGTGEGEEGDALSFEEIGGWEVFPVEGILVGGLDAGAGLPRDVGDGAVGCCLSMGVLVCGLFR